jgi:hypothetical protein
MAISILTSIVLPGIFGLEFVAAGAQSTLGVAMRMMTIVGRATLTRTTSSIIRKSRTDGTQSLP